MKSFHIKLEEKYHSKDNSEPKIEFEITKSRLIINGEEKENPFKEFIKKENMIYYKVSYTGKSILITFFNNNTAF